ncbi:hypothetical protein [Streptacidiphilus sp. EB129]|uniref:hypothetical protein n=1 Tax=Streptacidiphilus sp. EB129 TaxID=3156262 RepID=UPI0035176B9D
MATLCAALTGAAVSALVLTAAAPAVAATGGGQGGAGQVTSLVTTDNGAADPDVLTLDPGTTRPGGTVDLRTFAPCEGANTGTVTSPAFGAPVLLAPAADGGLFAEARVGGDTEPGGYRVVDSCGGKVVAVGTLRVAELGGLDTGGGWGATRAVARVAAGTEAGGLGAAGLGSARRGTARLESARLGSVPLGSARLGSVSWGSERLGSVPLGSVRSAGSLALTGTAAVGGLLLLRRRLRGAGRG